LPLQKGTRSCHACNGLLHKSWLATLQPPHLPPCYLPNQDVLHPHSLLAWLWTPILRMEELLQSCSNRRRPCWRLTNICKITFIDSSHVSFSNPIWQPLYELEDCLDGGKPKAECAAAIMKKIFPGIVCCFLILSESHFIVSRMQQDTLSIPMPGHPIPPAAASLAEAKATIQKLEQLFDKHGTIFLLMDAKESQWLPTVLGASKGKVSLVDCTHPYLIKDSTNTRSFSMLH